MGKKEFIALADAIRGTDASPQVIDALVAFCRSQNQRFNETRWRGYLAGTNGPNGGTPRKASAGSWQSGTPKKPTNLNLDGNDP